jgi:hypothetical protein
MLIHPRNQRQPLSVCHLIALPLSERETMSKTTQTSVVRRQTGGRAVKLVSLLVVCLGVLGFSLTTSTPKVTAAQKFQMKMPLGIDAEIWESLILKKNPTGPSVRSRRSQ